MKGALYINLGTPSGPDPASVGKYLREFLMDPLVIDIPFLFRYVLINYLIVPKRKYSSSEAYEKIWTDRGSPLLFHSEDLVKKVRSRLGFPCELGMRYGSPNILSALTKLKSEGVTELFVIPLYPQYALSSTESSFIEVGRALKKLNWKPSVRTLKDFYDSSWFINPLAEKIRSSVDLSQMDKIVFTFHGLPVRHVQKLDSSGDYCYKSKNCCDHMSSANRRCYRAQCFQTARLLAKELNLNEDNYLVTFQSRLGRSEWIRPYTDIEVPKLIGKKIAVISPSFVADCLETLEELRIRLRQDFLSAGGREFHFIECLNSDDLWADGLTQLTKTAPPD